MGVAGGGAGGLVGVTDGSALTAGEAGAASVSERSRLSPGGWFPPSDRSILAPRKDYRTNIKLLT